MKNFMEQQINKEELLSILRVRRFLCAIFLSAIVTADGEFLKEFIFEKLTSREHASKFTFPKEAPTQNHWQDCNHLLKQQVANVKLATPPWEWLYMTHQVWEWFYDHVGSRLQTQTSSGTSFHVPTPGLRRTLSEMRYVKCWELDDQPQGRPMSIKTVDASTFLLRAAGLNIATRPSQPQPFWDFLEIWREEWMWEGVDNPNRTDDMTWLVISMRNNTIM